MPHRRHQWCCRIFVQHVELKQEEEEEGEDVQGEGEEEEQEEQGDTTLPSSLPIVKLKGLFLSKTVFSVIGLKWIVLVGAWHKFNMIRGHTGKKKTRLFLKAGRWQNTRMAWEENYSHSCCLFACWFIFSLKRKSPSPGEWHLQNPVYLQSTTAWFNFVVVFSFWFVLSYVKQATSSTLRLSLESVNQVTWEGISQIVMP